VYLKGVLRCCDPNLSTSREQAMHWGRMVLLSIVATHLLGPFPVDRIGCRW